MFSIRRNSAAAFGAACLLAGPAASQMITLHSLDGKIAVTGALVEFDGSKYTIQNETGAFILNAEAVTCISNNCPGMSESAAINIAGFEKLGSALMPNLLSEFATATDFELVEQAETSTGGSADQSDYSLVDSSGAVFANVGILSSGTESGFDALLAGSAEMVMSARAVRPDETLAFISLGLGDISADANQTVVALDALNILVSPGNPVRTLSIEQIAQIFAGQITNWTDVGGPNQPISVYRRGAGSGTTNYFIDSILAPHALDFTSAAITAKDDTNLRAMVAGDEFAIGYAGFSVENNAKAVALRDNCGFPVRPTEFSIKTGEYPLSRRLYLYTSDARLAAAPDAARDTVRDFLSFAQTSQAQRAVADAGFINQDIVQLPIDAQGQRLTNALLAGLGDASYAELVDLTQNLRDAKRLSTTLRFRANSPDLDAQSVQDIARLAGYLSRTNMNGKELVFVGFTGSDGSANINSHLALRSAALALQVVSASLGASATTLNMVAEGYGEVAPLMCNNTVFGRALNQRVEIWVRDIT